MTLNLIIPVSLSLTLRLGGFGLCVPMYSDLERALETSLLPLLISYTALLGRNLFHMYYYYQHFFSLWSCLKILTNTFLYFTLYVTNFLMCIV